MKYYYNCLLLILLSLNSTAQSQEFLLRDDNKLCALQDMSYHNGVSLAGIVLQDDDLNTRRLRITFLDNDLNEIDHVLIEASEGGELTFTVSTYRTSDYWYVAYDEILSSDSDRQYHFLVINDDFEIVQDFIVPHQRDQCWIPSLIIDEVRDEAYFVHYCEVNISDSPSLFRIDLIDGLFTDSVIGFTFQGGGTGGIALNTLSQDEDYLYIHISAGNWYRYRKQSSGFVVSRSTRGIDIPDRGVGLTTFDRFELNADTTVVSTCREGVNRKLMHCVALVDIDEFFDNALHEVCFERDYNVYAVRQHPMTMSENRFFLASSVYLRHPIRPYIDEDVLQPNFAFIAEFDRELNIINEHEYIPSEGENSFLQVYGTESTGDGVLVYGGYHNLDSASFLNDHCFIVKYKEDKISLVPALDDALTDIQLFPNPSSGRFEIETSEPFDRIELIDFTGQVLFSVDVESTMSHELKLIDRHHGMYALRLIREQRLLGTDRVFLR